MCSYSPGFEYREPDEDSNGGDYAKSFSRSYDAAIRVYNDAGSKVETHEHAGDFKKPLGFFWCGILANRIFLHQRRNQRNTDGMEKLPGVAQCQAERDPETKIIRSRPWRS
jgi:hypothetical protein